MQNCRENANFHREFDRKPVHIYSQGIDDVLCTWRSSHAWFRRCRDLSGPSPDIQKRSEIASWARSHIIVMYFLIIYKSQLSENNVSGTGRGLVWSLQIHSWVPVSGLGHDKVPTSPKRSKWSGIVSQRLFWIITDQIYLKYLITNVLRWNSGRITNLISELRIRSAS